MDGPLEGLRVLDLSRHLAGPFAAMTLGDLGADVIKVEAPSIGDDTRRFPPDWNGISTYYLSTNRNKRGITLDLKSAGGQEIARKIAETADIVIENFRPGTTERFGLGYEDLRALNPRIVSTLQCQRSERRWPRPRQGRRRSSHAGGHRPHEHHRKVDAPRSGPERRSSI
ncbi:MAG: CoA transferase [Thermomicrobiales bacterium]